MEIARETKYSPTTEYTVTVGGLRGTVRFRSSYTELMGPWASHTGYRSLARRPPEADDKTAQQLAEAAYAEQTPYAFLVGDEHRDTGWRTLTVHDQRVEVRLPAWHIGLVAEALAACGLTQDEPSDPINHRWGTRRWPPGPLRRALSPLLTPGTRFTPEEDLARQLRRSARYAGLLDAPAQAAFDF